MKVTFPHMGNLYIALESIFQQLGIDIVLPPEINKDTVRIGTGNTPESACLPFKLVLGNFAQALDAGADTIVMLGGNGPCRFGYFGTLAAEILSNMGYRFELILLENNSFYKETNKIRKIAGAAWWQVAEAVRLGWAKLTTLDNLEKTLLKLRPREKKPGVASRLFEEAIALIREAGDLGQLRQIEARCSREMNRQWTDKEVLRVGLVGDIYMMLEPSANHQMQRILGALGVEVNRSIYVSDWLKHSILPHKFYQYKQRLLGAGKPYLKDFVGGHGLDSVANTVIYAREGYDGVIQVFPMTCMPEIVAQSLLPNVRQDYNIPVLTMVLDEHSNEAGIITRLEAFVDLIRKRKEAQVC